MSKTYTILQDDREKKPLLFPTALRILDPSQPPLKRRAATVGLVVEKGRYLTGDYLLKGHEHRMIVERKGHLDEVAGNCLTVSGRRKFVAECERLREACQRPVLLLEGTPRELAARRSYSKIDPDLARDALQRLCLEYGIEMVLLPNVGTSNRREVGKWIAALLVNSALTGPPKHASTLHPS